MNITKNITESTTLKAMRKALRNTECDGFFMSHIDNKVTVNRANDEKFDVTLESWRGTVSTIHSVPADVIERIVKEWFMISEEDDVERMEFLTYIPRRSIH